MSEELEPCPVPWCRSNSCDNYPPTVVRIAPMKYRPKCGWCGVSPDIDFITEVEALAAWNKRPNDSILELAQKVADATRLAELMNFDARSLLTVKSECRALAAALPRKP